MWEKMVGLRQGNTNAMIKGAVISVKTELITKVHAKKKQHKKC
jgi:hypothetical protein